MRDHATEHGRIEEESGRWNHEREAVSTLYIAASQRWRHDRCPRGIFPWEMMMNDGYMFRKTSNAMRHVGP